MEWEKASPELSRLLDAATKPFACQKKTMFGAPVYVVGGNMFAGVHADSIFIRLSEPDRKEIAALHATSPFEPVKGHVMKEYVSLTQAVYRDEKAMQAWLERAFEFARALPPKEPKRRPSKAAPGEIEDHEAES
ncbi:MAG: TfoX/Sxy family protein [Chloroflexi bacterium]|nr:TfoX/Sxy family protein [Chloroflexota bacterium]